MGLILILFAWPIWFIIISSVSDPYAITNGEVWLIPKGFQLEGFRKIFENKELFVATATASYIRWAAP